MGNVWAPLVTYYRNQEAAHFTLARGLDYITVDSVIIPRYYSGIYQQPYRYVLASEIYPLLTNKLLLHRLIKRLTWLRLVSHA